jgi:hypothetical protein
MLMHSVSDKLNFKINQNSRRNFLREFFLYVQIKFLIHYMFCNSQK